MPQINFYTFLSQTTWFLILFFFFYFTLKQYLLPLVFEQIKIKSLSSKTSETKTTASNTVSTSKILWNDLIFKIVNK